MSLGTRSDSGAKDEHPPQAEHSPQSPHSPRRGSGGGGSGSGGGNDADPFANLDPTLHPETLNNTGNSENNNPLTDFAQHVLDGRDNELLGFGSDEHALLAMGETRLDTLLEAAHKTERERQGLEGDGPHDFHFSADTARAVAAVAGGEQQHHEHEHEHGHEHERQQEHPQEHEHQQEQPMPPPPPPPSNGRFMGRTSTKRRREDGHLVVGPVENGEPIDPVKMKKDSHKEVERRRRENINDGINEIARYIPGGMDKIGKGLLLRRAAEFLAEVTGKLSRFDEELALRDRQKQEVETMLADSEARYQEERLRSMRFETSWREAEDRAANQQFELERLKAELEETKKKLADKS